LNISFINMNWCVISGGLDRFDAAYEGYEIAKKDVCIDKVL